MLFVISNSSSRLLLFRFLNAGCRKTFPVKTGLVCIPLISKYFTISNLENFAFPLMVKGNANHDVSTSGSCFGNSKNSISEKNVFFLENHQNL